MIVYDSQTSLIINAGQPWPSVYSNRNELFINQDGSLDVWFGPTSPEGKENNWIQTIPGIGWYTVLRIYNPLEAWFEKRWKPGEIEEVIY